MSLTAPPYLVSVAQYERMIQAGILTSDDRVELLEGVIVAKMPKNPAHIDAVYRIYEGLIRILPAGWFVNKEDPLVTAESMPEPDCVVVRGARDDYACRLPHAGDAALVVEVADSSLRQDRSDKKRIYARAAIPCYWLANLPARRIEAYTDPTGPTIDPDEPDYRSRRDFGMNDVILVVLDGLEIGRLAIRDLLPAGP